MQNPYGFEAHYSLILLCKRGRYLFSPKKRAPRNAKNRRGQGIDYPFEIGDEYEVEIEDMTPRGDGIAKIKGFPVFIGNAKPNEHVKIKITDIGSGCADAQIIP
jgi:predicted RNA-binding protein with TRAM domain